MRNIWIGGNKNRMRKWKSVFSMFVIVCMLSTTTAFAKENNEKEIDIVFTHDLHSHLDSFTTKLNGRQQKVGGFSRIATIIQEKKRENPATIAVDAGDFSMGTLYQTIYETQASELRMLGKIEVDVTTLGNHETDYWNEGLANMLRAAKDSGDPLPQFVLSNINLDDPKEEELVVKEAMESYGVKSYTVLEKNGIKIGVFGILGKTAIEYSPMAALTFSNQVESAKKAVKALKEEGVDIIICLSHSGTDVEPKKSEDEILAKEVPDIDVIISGHTHTTLKQPIIVGNTIIGSTGEYGIHVGSMKLVKQNDGNWELEQYELIPVTSDIEERKEIKEVLQRFHKTIEQEYLVHYGYKMGQVLAENEVEFTDISEIGKKHQEENLGNFITDAYIDTIKKEEGEKYQPIAAAIVPAGVIRETLPIGKITTEEAFMVMSLGIGKDKISGYPLISIYLTGKELKTAAEIDASISPMMNVAQLYTSGLHFTFNPNRLLFNRVTDVSLWDEQTKEQQLLDDNRLYRVVGDLYTGQMLGAVEGKSFGMLSIVPKDKDGQPIENLEDYIVYRNNGAELKAWTCIADYLQGAEEKTENGIAKVSKDYAKFQGRKIVDDSHDMKSLICKPNKFTWIAIGMIGIVFFLIGFLSFGIRRIFSKKR